MIHRRRQRAAVQSASNWIGRLAAALPDSLLMSGDAHLVQTKRPSVALRGPEYRVQINMPSGVRRFHVQRCIASDSTTFFHVRDCERPTFQRWLHRVV